MKYDSGKIVGTLLFIGSVQCLMVMVIAASLYPGYSISENYISDLGVGTTALLFNSSVFLLGATIVAAAYYVQRTFDSRLLFLLLTLTGIGAMGVGLFPEDVEVIHFVASLITFLFGGLTTITSCKLQKAPLSYFSVILGVMSLAALVLFGSGTYLGLGKGGMERMIAYPVLLWGVGFSTSLMNQDGERSAASRS